MPYHCIHSSDPNSCHHIKYSCVRSAVDFKKTFTDIELPAFDLLIHVLLEQSDAFTSTKQSHYLS